jgi:1-acyl-sn-glycerol-3-phosphate acyltransferase
LGSAPAQNPENCKKVPTVVMNHTTGIDALVAVALFNGKVCFLVGDHIRNVPFINYLIIASGGLFVPRGGTTAEKDATIEQLKSYQKKYQEGQS